MPTTMKLIAKNVLGSTTSSVTFSDIPGTYTDLMLLLSVRSDRVTGTTDDAEILFNSSTSNFTYRALRGSGSAASSSSGSTNLYGIINNASTTSNTFSNVEIYIPNYAGSTNKSFSVSVAHEDNASAAWIWLEAGLWSNTAAITSITLDLTSGSYVSGSSFFLYGILKA
jgi:hypothetical protein